MRDFSRVLVQNNENFSEAQSIFCWACHQAITLNDYIKGISIELTKADIVITRFRLMKKRYPQ